MFYSATNFNECYKPSFNKKNKDGSKNKNTNTIDIKPCCYTIPKNNHYLLNVNYFNTLDLTINKVKNLSKLNTILFLSKPRKNIYESNNIHIFFPRLSKQTIFILFLANYKNIIKFQKNKNKMNGEIFI